MKRCYLLAAALLLLPFGLGAQDIVTNDQSDDYYSDELGFFQKAYRDKSDPRFMFRDGKFEFGVGGRVMTSIYYDFAGALSGEKFVPSSISIPTDYTPNYGMSVLGSNVYFKARGTIGQHKLLAYAKLLSSPSDVALFDQAYISFDKFTIGKTYSFFSDLEAGPRTLNTSSVNSEVDRVHPLVGFTWRINPQMTFGAAVEEAKLNIDPYASYGLDTNYQSAPDIAMRFKYKGGKGHVQIAGLLRNLGYWVYDPPKKSNTDGESRYAFAWGVSLSGNWVPDSRLRFSAQATAGRGLSGYIRDFSGCPLTLAMEEELYEGLPLLRTRSIAAGFVSSQVKWSESLSSNITGGYAFVGKDPDTYCGSDLKSTVFASVNLMYDLSNYCFMGLECIHGRSENYPSSAATSTTGHANRLLFVFAYSF